MSERTLLFEKLIVLNKEGLNLLFSRMIAQSLRAFNAEIKILGFEGEADAKCPLDIMSLAIEYKETIILLAKGDDAKCAVDRVVEILSLDQCMSMAVG